MGLTKFFYRNPFASIVLVEQFNNCFLATPATGLLLAELFHYFLVLMSGSKTIGHLTIFSHGAG
jgi:hypothetical protein